MPFDLSPRSLLPPPRPPFRWWLPLPYLTMLTFALRWSTLATGRPGALGVVTVALGGWLLGLCAYRSSKSHYSAWWGGIVYCFVCSVSERFGHQALGELTANCCCIAAWLVAVAPREYGQTYRQEEPLAVRLRHWSVAGLLLGVATVVRPLAATALLAVAGQAYHYYRRRRQQPREGRQAVGYLLAAGGGVVAVGLASSSFATGSVGFGDWGQQALLLGRYLLYFSPPLLFSFLLLFGNILTKGTYHFNPLLRYQVQALVLAILLFGGGRADTLVLLHPALALQCTDWLMAKGGPTDSSKHSLALLWVLAAGTVVGCLYGV